MITLRRSLAILAAAAICAPVADYLYNAIIVTLYTTGPADCRAPFLMFVWTWPVWKVAPADWFASFVQWSMQFCVQ